MKVHPVNKQEFIVKTKAFFQSQKWKNLLVFLIFVVLAFCFWTLQYFQQKIERDISISIHYTQIPDEIVLSDSLPAEITCRIADKGTVFLRYFLNKNFTVFNVHLKDLPLNKHIYTIDKANIYAQIQSLLPNTTQIVSFQPETIQIRYSPLAKKEVPVLIDGILSPAVGYMFMDNLHINPDSVWVYADKTTLDTLQWIKTVAVKKENIQKKLDLTLKLNSPKGAHLSIQKVKVTAELEEYTEKKFELPVVCRNLPENIHVRFFPSTVEVACRLTLSKYPLLNASDLEVEVDYNELAQRQGITASPALTHKPQWLIDYRIVPETVEYLLEQKQEL
jgi:hypothetical protein